MNKTSMIGILMVVGLVSLIAAPAASGESMDKFNVPFQFVAGDRVLPAGEYLIKVDHARRLFEIRQAWTNEGAYLPAVPVSSVETSKIGKLVFGVYGSVRVLEKVWIGGRSSGAELRLSKAQRELAKAAGTNLTARAVVEVPSAQ